MLLRVHTENLKKIGRKKNIYRVYIRALKEIPKIKSLWPKGRFLFQGQSSNGKHFFFVTYMYKEERTCTEKFYTQFVNKPCAIANSKLKKFNCK